MMKVAVNAAPLLHPLTGIGQYVKALMTELERCGQCDLSYFYATRWNKALRDQPFPPEISSLKDYVRRYLPNAYAISRKIQQRRFSAGVKSESFDLYHEPNFLAFDFDGPTVVTVHDLSWIRYPETHPVERVRAMDKYFPISLERAEKIIVPTSFVKCELTDVFGIEENKIHVTYGACEDEIHEKTAEEIAPTLSKYSLEPNGYWISVGTLEPRKNLPVMLEAFSQLSAAERRKCPLVIVGMTGWRYHDLLANIRQMVDNGEVIYTGYLQREEQMLLMAGARALIYPSLYEGFGLPLVEAMRCALPIIAADASCLPEVLGGAGKLADPRDPQSFKLAMRELLEDPAEFDRLRTLSRIRGKDFSWSRCATETMQVYKLAMA